MILFFFVGKFRYFFFVCYKNDVFFIMKVEGLSKLLWLFVVLFFLEDFGLINCMEIYLKWMFMVIYWFVYMVLDFWKGKEWVYCLSLVFFVCICMICWMILYSNVRKFTVCDICKRLWFVIIKVSMFNVIYGF